MAQAETLDDGQLALLMDMAAALQGGVAQWTNSESDIVTEAFASNMANRLRLHHATNDEKFKKKAFEYALRAAARADGREASIVSDPTHAGEDVLIDEVAYSLKTEASESIRVDRITISKLMEARWIRNLATAADCATAMSTHVLPHLSSYERILDLRAYDDASGVVTYELWEIPVALLKRVGALQPTDFKDPNENGSSSARVKEGGATLFTVRLDGSVEKVTISGLLTDRCRLHARWSLPTSASDTP